MNSNSNSNTFFEVRIFELRLTSLVSPTAMLVMRCVHVLQRLCGLVSGVDGVLDKASYSTYILSDSTVSSFCGQSFRSMVPLTASSHCSTGSN